MRRLGAIAHFLLVAIWSFAAGMAEANQCSARETPYSFCLAKGYYAMSCAGLKDSCRPGQLLCLKRGNLPAICAEAAGRSTQEMACTLADSWGKGTIRVAQAIQAVL